MKIKLNQPYPFYYESWKNLFFQALVLAVVVTFFLYLFQPFSYTIAEHRFSFFTISLLNGLLASLTFLVLIAILKILFPNFFQSQKWTVGKETGFWMAFLLLVGIVMFFRRELIYDNPDNLSFRYFVAEVVNTFLVGSFFAIIGVMINYIHLLKSTSEKAKTWDERVQYFHQLQPKNAVITITAEAPQDQISFRLSEFMYAMVDGNYVEFYLQDQEGNILRLIKRNTLSNTEEQLKDYPDILRVHRSYLVNMRKIDSVNGNAQGYKLRLINTENHIPVSRSYISSFESAVQQ